MLIRLYIGIIDIQSVPKLFIQINMGDREHEKQIYFVMEHMAPDGNF